MRTCTKHKNRKMRLWLMLCLVFLSSAAIAADWEEGGYVGSKYEGNEQTVYNFLRHFRYNQYYYSHRSQFTYNNNYRVDAMDFAFFSGHGNPWRIQMTDKSSVDLSTAGYSSHRGYGRDLEFIAFEACKVVPSPKETRYWWKPWIREPRDVFDGMHQALGYRSNSYMSTDQDIAYYFGSKMRQGARVWQSWFDANNRYGRSYQFSSAVMYPNAKYDTYGRVCGDPNPSHTNLTIWYQY